jgi:transcriptional regulator GlxA family with amidase domain
MATSEATFERHFTVDELAALWGMSDDFVRRLFLHESGVVIFYHSPPRTGGFIGRSAFPSP